MSLQSEQVVILAGGLGTRLRPITEKIPKVLVEVKGQPFLYWQLKYLKTQGFRDILLLCAYLGEQIRSEFGTGEALGLNLRYSFEPDPMGTGGALLHASAQLKEKFFLVNGDSFLPMDMNAMLKYFSENNFTAMMSAFQNQESAVRPNLKVGEDGVVSDYKKNGGSEAGYNAVDSGIYYLKKELFSHPSPSRFQLEDLWPNLIANSKLGVFFESQRFYDIGTPERLKIFEERLSDYFPDAI